MAYNEEPSKETSDRWRNDPDNWVWGIFYYNKHDPRIFPPKKIEAMGFTINFANPKSVIGFVLGLAFFTIITFFISSRS